MYLPVPRKFTLHASVEEYCYEPIDPEQWAVLQSAREESEAALKKHDLINKVFAWLAVLFVISCIVVFMVLGVPLIPEDGDLLVQSMLLLGGLAGCCVYVMLIRQCYCDFLLITECSLTIAGVKLINDRGVRYWNDRELAQAYQIFKPVKIGHSRAGLRPLTSQLLKNVDRQQRQLMAFEYDLIRKLQSGAS